MNQPVLQNWKEKNGSSSYVILATLMLVAIGLYAVLPPLLSKERFPNTPSPGSEDTSQSTPGVSISATLEPGGDHTNGGAHHGNSKEVLKKDEDDPFIVHTQYGPIKSTERAGVRVFHGVRFAAPPLNSLRWRMPQAVEPWGPAVYDATWVRPGCPQKYETLFYPANGTSEDCLYLEIYAPFYTSSNEAGHNQREPHRMPVLIYIHGGGFRDMSSTTPIFDAAHLAGRGNMIVVLPDYRIGSLGFLFTGTSPDEVGGNFGILDQKFAIEWVVNNIETFGGDPTRITLAGHSAGALSVIIHLTTPDTARHFQHVILSSTPLTIPFRTTTSAIARAHTLANQLGCLNEPKSAPDIECLKNKSVEEIQAAEAYMAAHAASALGALLDRINPWGPVIDGEFVRASPLDAIFQFAAEEISNISKLKPMMMGLTTDEASMFSNQTSKFKSVGRLYLVLLNSVTGVDLNLLSDMYPIEDINDVSGDIATALTDFMFRCPLRALQRRLVAPEVKMENNSNGAAGVKFWPYLWCAPMSGNLPSDIEFCRGKSCHGAELPYLFLSSNQSAGRPDKHQQILSDSVIDYVANFVTTGDPNNYNRKGDGFHNEKVRTRREIKVFHTIFKRWRKSNSRSLLQEYVTNLKVNNAVKTQHERSIAEHHPYWEPVTATSGYSEEPTWLVSELNFPKNAKIKMAKQALIKGRQCDMWDQTGYRFPKLFGS